CFVWSKKVTRRLRDLPQRSSARAALIAKRTSAVFYSQDGQDGLRPSIERAGASSRRFKIRRCAISILRFVLFRLLSCAQILAARRREGAVGHRMDGPPPPMSGPPSLARSKPPLEISWPRKPRQEVIS